MYIAKAPLPVWSACGECACPDAPKSCSSCGLVRYCDVQCQRSDWRAFHKAECGKISTSATPASLAVSSKGHASRGVARMEASCGNYDEAEAACVQAIRCFRLSEGGPVCMATGTGLHDLAVIQSKRPERIELAYATAVRALAIRTTVGDPTLDDQIETSLLVAQILRRMQDPRAAAAYESVLELYERRGETLSVDYAAALGSYAIERVGVDPARSVELGQRSLAVLRSVPARMQRGEYWDTLARTLQNLSGALLMTSELTAGVRATCTVMLTEALQIRMTKHEAACSPVELEGLYKSLASIVE